MPKSLSPIPLPSQFIKLCVSIKEAGGCAYLVGGIVRDHLLSLPPKDIDIEVHHLEPERLLNILKQYGHPKAVGKSFGIWKMCLGADEIDVALPRRGDEIDVHVGLEAACRRRDLRLNAIVYDPTTEQYHDLFQGIQDIEECVLRATDPTHFVEDPLRVLRVAQFAARFHFSVDASLIALCQEQTLSKIASERVLVEFEKCWLKSTHPSIGIRYFLQLLVIEKYFPTWPGLGDEEVLQSLDRGKKCCTELIGWNMALFWALSLQRCTTSQAEAILDTLKIFSFHNFKIREAVLSSLQYSRTLAEKEDSILRNHAAESFRLDFLCTVADIIWPKGKGTLNLELATSANISCQPLPKLVQGRDLLSLQISGETIGQCLKFLRQEQLNEQITTREEALASALSWIESC